MERKAKRLSQQLFDKLNGSGKTLATAESCTSGQIAQTITSTPGASDYFVGGIVSYASRIKTQYLKVDASVIEAQTAVCEDVARQMVIGACKTFGTDYAIAATGFAGPGSERGIPVGTIWIACGTKDFVRTLMLSGDNGREKNLHNATCQALQLMIDYLK